MRTTVSRVAFLISLLGLPGCGNSGPNTTTVHSTPALDGYVTASGLVQAGDLGMSAGDSTGNDSSRMFVSFPLRSVPAGATIQSAVLELRQITVNGNPYVDLGPLVVDHLDYGGSLDKEDYSAGAISAAFVESSTDARLEIKPCDVKSQVQADFAAGRSQSQFRLRFVGTTNDDSAADYARFATAESGADGPTLKLTYVR